MVYKSLNCLAPDYLSSKFIQRSEIFNSYNLRDSKNKLAVLLPHTNYYRNSFCYRWAVLWNNLPTDIRQTKSSTTFWQLSSKFIQRSEIFNSITLETLKKSLLFSCHIPITIEIASATDGLFCGIICPRTKDKLNPRLPFGNC